MSIHTHLTHLRLTWHDSYTPGTPGLGSTYALLKQFTGEAGFRFTWTHTDTVASSSGVPSGVPGAAQVSGLDLNLCCVLLQT